MGTPGPGDAAEIREQMRRLRTLPVDQVLGDALFTLLQAAQVKLGRRDARLLIDVAAVVHEQSQPYLPAELTEQVGQVLGQLRLGQVQAESNAGQPEENDLNRPTAPPPADEGQ